MSYPKPMHWWVENVLPLVYDGSLSYYEIISKVTEYINGLTGDMTEVKSQIENINATIETLDPERIETLLTEVDALATAVNGMEGRVGNLETDNTTNKSDIDELKNSVNQLESDVSTLDTNVQNYGDRLGNVEEQVSNYNERITNAETLARTASTNTAALGERVNMAEEKVNNVEDKADNYSKAIAQSEEWYTATRSYVPHDLVFVGSTLYEVINNIASGDSLTIGSNIKAVTISENNKEIKSSLESLNTDIDGAKDDVENLKTDVNELKDDVTQNTEDIENLKTDTNNLKSAINTKAPVIINTASGAIASFNDGADGTPVKALTIDGAESATVTRAGLNVADAEKFSIEKPSFSTDQYWLGLTKNSDGTFTLTRPLGWGGNGKVFLGTFVAGTYTVSFELINNADVRCAASLAINKTGTWEASSNGITITPSIGRNAFSPFTVSEPSDIWISVGPFNDNGAQVVSGNYQVESGATAHAYEPYTGAEFVYPSEAVTTLYGVNNIWSDVGAVAVSYCADTKLYIDNKIAELQATVLENIGG